MKITIITKDNGYERIGHKEIVFSKELKFLKGGIKTILEISHLKKESVAVTAYRLNQLLDELEVTCHPSEE